MRSLQNEQDYINAEISEKVTLVHVTASSRLYGFNNPSSNVYTKSTNYIVTDVSGFTGRSDSSVGLNEFFYDIPTKTLYLGYDSDIDLAKIIVDYRLFFSDGPVTTTWNLEDISHEVEYEARVNRAPEFKTNVGVNQKGTSLTNSGNLDLENNDGYFDSIFDFLVFENKEVVVYSWNRDLNPSEAFIVYRGNTYNKSFSSDKISLQVKNSYTRIEESIVLDTYKQSDNVSEQYIGQYKRRIYGRVNQALVRSVDQIGSGYQITGTVSTDITADAQVSGNLTLFTSELSVSDRIEVNSQEFTVKSIADDTSMVISSNDPIHNSADASGYSKVETTKLTGVISVELLTPSTIDGTGTLFTTELSAGESIEVRGNKYNIKTIVSDIELELDTNVLSLFTNAAYDKYDLTPLTGEISFNPPARSVFGTGTSFLDELSPEDEITFNDQTYVIEDVLSDTEFIIDGDSPIISDVTNITATNNPEIFWRKKNREFLIAGHALHEYSSDITKINELNRLFVTDASGFSSGDVVTIMNGTTPIQNAEILRIVDNQITFKFNLKSRYPIGYLVKKQPVSKVYVDTVEVNINDITDIDNQTTGCMFTLDNLTEFNITQTKNIPFPLIFTADSREVNLSVFNQTDLTNTLKPRDWIKAPNDPDSYFVEILKVESSKIILRTPYQGGSKISTASYRNPTFISDDSSVTVDCLGATEDGTPTGALLENGPEIVRSLLNEINLTSILDNASFDDARLDAPYKVSLVIPENITSTSLPTIKDIVDKVSKTVFGALTINNLLQLSYNILDVRVPENKDLVVVRFDDLKDWKVSSKSGNLYKEVNVNFNFKDYDNNSRSEDKDVLNIESEFVVDFDTSNKTDEINLYTSDEVDAQELGERYVYTNSLAQSEITLTSDLRLKDLSIGQTIILDIPRLYTRLGDSSTTLKVAKVTGKQVSGKEVTLSVSDLGNIFNRSSIISSDDEVEFSLADSESKIYAAYITSENGSINNDEDTVNNNLIF